MDKMKNDIILYILLIQSKIYVIGIMEQCTKSSNYLKFARIKQCSNIKIV